MEGTISQWRPALAILLLLAVAACGPDKTPPRHTASAPRPAPTQPAPTPDDSDASDPATRLETAPDIDADRIVHADATPGDWLSNGRTYSEQRYSPLAAINRDTVKTLGLDWEFRTNTVRGLEATPIVANGIMFVTGSWSKVWALDARTGRQLWFYDPEVPGQWARYACCDVVNRGVAVWKGAVYLATLDGRLIKLDARTGRPVWDIATAPRNRPYTITGAPRVIKDMVIVGTAGGALGVRGYLTAYNADTGRELWRFYTVPGSASEPLENAAMADALKTWPATEITNAAPGGGAPADGMAYDSDLDLLYVGTGGGSPALRSGGGNDRLYLSSILALKPGTGELVWHYQTTPGGSFGYGATEPLMLADVVIGGSLRKALLQASSNGFFYVLDRATGKLMSAAPYTDVTWAKSVDPNSGRPVENPALRITWRPATVSPVPGGTHGWQPMALSPDTNLVYIPVVDGTSVTVAPRALSAKPGLWNTIDLTDRAQAALAALKQNAAPGAPRGFVRAWDPAQQKTVWQAELGGGWSAGLLATAGGLVFGGGADGLFAAYDAKTGAKLWSMDMKTAIAAPPIAYTVDGEQYIAVVAAYAGGINASTDTNTAVEKYRNNQGRIFAFKLGAGLTVQPIAADFSNLVPEPPHEAVDPKLAQRGFALYHQACAACHGVLMNATGEIPDLRYSSTEVWKQYNAIVRDDALSDGGMPSFKDVLSADDVTAIRAYALEQAQALYAKGQKPASAAPPHP